MIARMIEISAAWRGDSEIGYVALPEGANELLAAALFGFLQTSMTARADARQITVERRMEGGTPPESCASVTICIGEEVPESDTRCCERIARVEIPCP